jgi:hypothetical protein
MATPKITFANGGIIDPKAAEDAGKRMARLFSQYVVAPRFTLIEEARTFPVTQYVNVFYEGPRHGMIVDRRRDEPYRDHIVMIESEFDHGMLRPLSKAEMAYYNTPRPAMRYLHARTFDLYINSQQFNVALYKFDGCS